MMIDLFSHDYVTYDQYGLAQVRCMATNVPIKTRMEEPSRLDPKRFVYVVGKHHNYREIPVLLSDGSTSFLMVSQEMEDMEIGEEEAARITQQLIRAKKLELDNAGRPREVVASVIEGMSERKKVLRRLTKQEIKQRFGGNE